MSSRASADISVLLIIVALLLFAAFPKGQVLWLCELLLGVSSGMSFQREYGSLEER